ncbi:MAG: methionine--tRNA ligase subunit beta, partial [Bacteroidales bacterium]|nr:methionine--tRNA ligase subunit beta [Bacteroidales bacterium]
FHCIVFPVMLKAHGGYILPDNVPANEFLNLEGDKISTSRNWAVWLNEYLEDFKDQQDTLRYVLTANAPETKDNDFTWKDFQARNNNELVAILGNFINRVVVLTHKYFGGKVPAQGQLTETDKQALQAIVEAKENISKNIENYRFRDALKDAMQLARVGNKYLTETEPWKLIKTDEARVATILNVGLQITANCGILFEPFLPFSAKKILKMMNLASATWNDAGNVNLMEEGKEIAQAELLFRKIEDVEVDAQIERLKKIKAEQEAQAAMNAPVAPQKETITYDDFAKMDIRMGTILAAERVPKTDKLMKLTVNVGIDTRTIVSGIAEHFTPEECVGRHVCVLVNLKPRTMKNIESLGMILMAENADGTLHFIETEKKIKDGSAIS